MFRANIKTYKTSVVGLNVILLPAKIIFSKLLTKRNRGLESTKNFIESYVWNILLYDYGSWTISVWDKNKLEIPEIWMRNKMVCIN